MSPVTATAHAMPSTSSASLVSPQQKSDKSPRTPTGQSTQRQRQRHKQVPGRGKQSGSNKTIREGKEVTSASGRLDELACIAFGPVVLHAPIHQQRDAPSRLPHGLPAARDTAILRTAQRPPAHPPSNLHRPRERARHANASQGPNRPLLGQPSELQPASTHTVCYTTSFLQSPSTIPVSRGPIVDYQTESFLPLSCSSF
ncbi:hypothetical protein CNYM01_04799 [Colletotrichum nymphaeae SA-01]|uniref:Uncharacterized protein n=1 Tax=Colletotrichum nymphaeae SA-01 TaxID=1460502 RepID=A0A135S5Z7_9PEZI|nr:hypothetical protein CNYM01_04799 [Colletotrichum nymphaeae SA-01]